MKFSHAAVRSYKISVKFILRSVVKILQEVFCFAQFTFLLSFNCSVKFGIQRILTYFVLIRA